MSDAPLVIAGLGNPGEKYARTRHNIGQMALDTLAARHRLTFGTHRKSGSELVTGRIDGRAVVLVRPRAYMNVSGTQIALAAKFYSVPAENIVVVHDDLDLDFGTLRLKRGGGEGGHNGLRSLTAAVGTKDYLRVRVGIGRPPGRTDPAAYVLKPFSAAEARELDLVREQTGDAIEALVADGLQAAQNRVHAG